MAYRSSTTNNGSSTTASATVPAGVAAGDVVLLCVNADNNAWDFATKWPAGFTALTSATQSAPDGQGNGIAYKRLTGADAGSYTLAAQSVSTQWVAQAFAFSDRHASNPPAASTPAQLAGTGATGTITATANGVTALDGDDLLHLIAPDLGAATAYTTNSGVAPSTFTKRQDQIAAAGWSVLIGSTKDNVVAGATGNVAGTFSNGAGANAGWTAYLVRVPVGVTVDDTNKPALIGMFTPQLREDGWF